MKIVKAGGIEAGLREQGRVYLCGKLERENGVEHIPTTGYEIGISDYPSYTFEKAHYHAFNREYNYVMEGMVRILLLNEGREYLFRKGDLFMIDVNEPYVGKALAGTRTIFSKVPGGNDKVLVPMGEDLARWGAAWDVSWEEAAEGGFSQP